MLKRHLKTLIPEGNVSNTWFMALFLLCLPLDMRDHIVAKNSDSQEMMVKELFHWGQRDRAEGGMTTREIERESPF